MAKSGKRLRILRRPRRKLTPEERARRHARRRRTLKVLPSLFTMGNAVCGFAAIVHVAAIQIDPVTLTMTNPENLAHAGWLLLLGMLFDILDGRIARLTNTTGDFGGELDSLCDAVSFGVAPALMVVMTNSAALSEALGHPLWWRFAWLSGLVFLAGAVLRLARFNVEIQGHDEESHAYFKGLPSPAAAGTIATLAILQGYLRSTQELSGLFSQATLLTVADGISYVLPVVALASGWLMVSNVRYVHVGNRFLRGRRPARSLAQAVIIGIFIFAIVPEIALTLTFFGFAVSGVILHLLRASSPPEESGGSEEGAPDESCGDELDEDELADADLFEEGAEEATEDEAEAEDEHRAEPPAGADDDGATRKAAGQR